MTQIGLPVQFAPRFGRGYALSVIGGLALTLAWPAPSQAARLTRFLTSDDLAGRMVLDENGQTIQIPTAADRHPDVPKGSTPTYLAIPLYGGEHLPASIPTLETGAQQSESPVGPLNFDTLVKTSLDATLANTRLAIVDTATENYLVEFLPRRDHSTLSLDKALGSASNAVNGLSSLLNSNPLTKLSQSGMSELDKLLHISSKTSTSAPSLNLEAQVLNSDGMPATVPEPGMWTIFAGLMAALGIYRRRRPV